MRATKPSFAPCAITLVVVVGGVLLGLALASWAIAGFPYLFPVVDFIGAIALVALLAVGTATKRKTASVLSLYAIIALAVAGAMILLKSLAGLFAI